MPVRNKRRYSPKTLRNILTLLIANLNAAKNDLGWIPEVPKIKKPKCPKSDFAYLRTKEETARFLAAARAEGESVYERYTKRRRKETWEGREWEQHDWSDFLYVFYTTAVCTGMRAGELAGLEWGDIDFDRRLITVQRSFTGPTKGGEVRYVPILNDLLPILRSWRLRIHRVSQVVFPNERGRMHGESARIFQETFHRVLDRGEFPGRWIDKKLHRYIRFHDLRHTFASHWMMDDGDIFKLQKILGHKSIQMTMRYAHLAPRSVRGGLRPTERLRSS